MTTEKVIVRAAAGRQLEALASGPPDGLAVVLQNGTPAGLMAAPAIAAVAAERGLRLVLYARPGYEGSTRPPAAGSPTPPPTSGPFWMPWARRSS